MQHCPSRTSLLLLALLSGCNATLDGDGPPGAAQTVAVEVAPGAVALAPRQSYAFAALVTGTIDTRVTWSIREGSPASGTVAADGRYTAPAAAGTFHVVATLATDASKTGSATVTVTAAPVVTVAVSPPSATMAAGASRTFTCTVTGSADTACTFAVLEAGGGTIGAATGLYQAPAAPGTYHVVATSHADPTRAAQAAVTVVAPCTSPDVLRYAISRPATPALYHRDLTLKVVVGTATQVTVTVDGTPVPALLDGTGRVIFTASGSSVEVCPTGANPSVAGYGDVTKAVLKHDKKWAWSHGFDDNVNFRVHGIPAFQEKGWRATVFLIGNVVDSTRNESWIVDRPAILDLVRAGWGIGNHSWSHDTVAGIGGATAARNDIARCRDRLRAIVDEVNPAYRLISFAAPVFDSAYQPVINAIRDGEPALEIQFNESGNDFMPQVDPGAFNRKATLGRDPGIEGFGTGSATYDNKPTVDRIHGLADSTHHYWYNTLSHGVDSQYPGQGVYRFISYLHANYGPGGADEVWVAPSDEVYSYLVTRDGSTVTRQ
jgi:peptidoglycan/xylan/chitin deacetylase (PgdA/CDA1 family)